MRLKITLLFIYFIGHFVQAQDSKFLKYEAKLVVDNDAFTLNLYKDQYYTSGIFPSFRYIKDSASHHRIIHSFQLNHRIFTPKDITWGLEDLLDRPYAGQISGSFISQHYFESETYLQLQVEIGWMGPSTKIAETQTHWHHFFNMGIPKGWKYQINDTPIATFYFTYAKSLFRSERFELLSESNLGVGTVNDWLRQEFAIRYGNFLEINRGAFYSAKTGYHRTKSKFKRLEEAYLFYAPGLEFVAYNASIEGNFIGKPSTYIEKTVPWIIQHRFGAMLSWPVYDLGFTGYVRSKETTEATGHYYIGIRMNQRF